MDKIKQKGSEVAFSVQVQSNVLMKVSKRKSAAILVAALSLTFCSQVLASDTDFAYYNGEKFIEFEFFNEGEFVSQYTLADALRNATKSATSYWSGILGARSNYSSPWQIMVLTKANFQNASAGTASFLNGEETKDNYVSKLLQGNINLNYINFKPLANSVVDSDDEDAIDATIKEVIPNDNAAFSMVRIGQHFGANRDGAIDGWWIDTDTVLPTNEQAADFVGCFRHELGHALGISAEQTNCDWNGETIEDENEKLTFGENNLTLSKFSDSITDTNNWIYHLTDKNGNHAKAGMLIITSDAFNNIVKAENPAAVESDYFIIDEGDFAYFIGDNVTAALEGATFNGISGLPVNGWEEGEDDTFFEGSHFQTAGMMSHRTYSNYTSFLEVELAAMQDLGYDFDRKAYFGYSIYGNGGTINNTQGYSARNSDGTAYTSDFSTVPLGVGLHVYGANNNVTQSANILTRGTGAVGIRVDGEGNTINIPATTEIHSDGLRGKGVLISYGRNQNLNLDGIVTAEGQGGNAVEFNFGSSSNGALDEYRGSYIRYTRNVNEKTGEITTGRNLTLTDMDNNTYNSSADELNGELVTNFNLNGKITGGENAIYIGKNALVKNINVNSGAEINGNITSDWKHFSESDGFFSEARENLNEDIYITPLNIQYNGGQYHYNQYIPDLVTNLNFNSDLTYSGNITGADNIKMNVNAGTFNYGGAADVLNVNVASGAKVFGGTYTVNDVSENLADGFTDDTTGKFFNHGTISGLTINGNLISDGTLTDEAGKITVNGAANVEGSTVVSAEDLEIGESTTVLTANSVTGKLANDINNPVAISSLLGYYGDIDGNKINYTVSFADNFGDLNDEQSTAIKSLKNMAAALKGDSRKSELSPLYTIDAANAKTALSEIGNSDAAQNISAIQQNAVASKVISERLTTAFSSETVDFQVGGNNFADGDNGVVMGVSADYPASVDNNFWIKFTKNWGKLNGDAKYHGSAISGGYDRAFGGNWRGGIFVSYNTTNLGAKFSNGDLNDTRGGIYFGYHNDVDDAFIYIDGGKVRNKFNRALPTLGLGASANYDSKIFEIGGEYKRNLTPEKSVAVSPFINLQYSHLKQDAYNETGAGVFNQHVNSESNNYFAGTLGFEFKRVLSNGNFAARIGVKHAFTGANPELNFSYEGDGNNFYKLKNNQDKTHFVLSLSGENEFAHGWILGGEFGFQKGGHDRDVTASVILRKVW